MERAVVGVGDGESRFGLEERMLDALCLEGLGDGVRAGGECRIDVAAHILAAREHVRIGAPDCDLRVVDCGHRIDDRPQRHIVDLHQLSRRSCLSSRLCDDDREHVTGIRGAFTLADEHRPVLVDDADLAHTGNVGGSEHRHDARSRLGC